VAAIARPGGPTLFRAQVSGSWEADVGSSRAGKVIEFGPDGDVFVAVNADDAHHKRPREPADFDASSAPRSQRPAAPKLAEVRAVESETGFTTGGGADDRAGGCVGSDDDDDADDDDIPDVVLESADEDE
jgi:hypothetical protein